MIRLTILINFFAALLCVITTAQAEKFPTDSIYRLNVPLTTQDGRTVSLPSLSGHVRIVTMFYASCSYVCPMTIQSLKDLELGLSEQDRSRLRILMVSIDPDRDSAEALRALAAKHELDATRWSLARANKTDIRKLAGMLGVQYRQLENREFNHSTILTLVSTEGIIVARTDSNNGIDSTFKTQLQKLLDQR